MRHAIILALLIIPLASYAADGVVGDAYREKFNYSYGGTLITDATLAQFSTTWQKNGATVASESAAFRNFSTGAYSMNWTPSTTGWFTGTIYYNSTTVVAEWTTIVYSKDVDDVSGANFDNFTTKFRHMPDVYPF